MNLTIFAGILLAVTMVTARRASLGDQTMQAAAGKADEPDEATREAARPAKLVEKIMRAAAEADELDEAERESIGWFKYQIIHERKTWTEAKDDCEARGAKLAMLRSKPEAEEAGKLRELKDSEQYWIGGFLGWENYITKYPRHYGHMGMTLMRDKNGDIQGEHMTQELRLNFICQKNLGDDGQKMNERMNVNKRPTGCPWALNCKNPNRDQNELNCCYGSPPVFRDV